MQFEHEQIPAKRHRLQHLDLYDVSGDELDNIEQLGTNVGTDLQFCTFWLPVGIASNLTLLNASFQSAHVYEAYLVATFVGYGFGAFFGIRWYITRGNFRRCIDKIRERQIGPVGEEGKELKPSELDSLPAGTPQSTKEK